VSPMTSVSEAYLGLAVMTLVGIGFPVGSFIASRLLRPVVDPNDSTKTRSWLLPGYEVDQSLYVRRESTYECGSAPVGDAHINFHFQYYWYAIIFLVFDIAFMFLAFGGIISIQEEISNSQIMGALTTMSIFIALMSLGVWHVFRKRGRIYI
jgi:NADH:ubiquinone oxidoreductase subunit 3 (subunit A)